MTVDPAIDSTEQPYAYASNDPVDNADPAGLWCLGPICSHHFDPMASVDAAVNIGRGATFGLTDKVANWISPGASCTVPQNGVDQFLGVTASTLIGGEAAVGAARWAALRFGAAAESATPLFGQTTASAVFREGPFAGRTIGDVAAALRAGDGSAADMPVDVIVRDGETIGLNTRSMLALRRAGIPVKDWVINDVTGNPAMERLLTERLARNGLNGGTGLLRITGSGPNASSLR